MHIYIHTFSNLSAISFYPHWVWDLQNSEYKKIYTYFSYNFQYHTTSSIFNTMQYHILMWCIINFQYHMTSHSQVMHNKFILINLYTTRHHIFKWCIIKSFKSNLSSSISGQRVARFVDSISIKNTKSRDEVTNIRLYLNIKTWLIRFLLLKVHPIHMD